MSSPAITLIRGDTNRVNLTVRRPLVDFGTGQQLRDTAGNLRWEAVDLTGAELWLTARTAANAVSFALDSGAGTIVINDPPTAGLAVATVAPTVTSAFDTPLWLDYDVQLVEQDGTKTTVAKGQFVVSSDVTLT